MERRSDIRAAMQRLLTPEQGRENAPERLPRIQAAHPPAVSPGAGAASSPEAVPAFEWHGTPIEEIQRVLREYGVSAECPEIVHALMVTLAARPVLCFGLFASYLLGGNE